MDLGSGSMMPMMPMIQAMTAQNKRSHDNQLNPADNPADKPADNHVVDPVYPRWAKRLCIRLLETCDVTHHPVPLLHPQYDERTVSMSAQKMYSHFDGTTFPSERDNEEPTAENLIELVDAKLYHLHGALVETNSKIRDMNALRVQTQREHQEAVRELRTTIDTLQQKMGILKNDVAGLIDSSEAIASSTEAHRKRVEGIALTLMD